MSDIENERPHLDPRSVVALAASIPNCSQVTPPTAPSSCNFSNHSSSGRGSSKHSGSGGSNNSSASSGSSFSHFSNYIHQAFSGEEKDQKHQQPTILEHGVLSFLVSDAYSIEQLAAEASGKRSTSELEGAGIARIDVYCQTGTVCTCRVVQTSVPMAEEDEGSNSKSGSSNTASSTSVSGDSSSGSFMDNMFYPTKTNANPAKSSKNSKDGSQDGSNPLGKNTQLRRIIRRKCTLEALRRILEQPPKLPEVNEDIISLTTGKSSSGNDSDNDSQLSTVSKKLRKRQLRRSQKAFSASLSKEQQKFMKQQQKQYEKRMKRDEKARQNLGNAILMGGMAGADVGDLKSMRSLSLDSASSVGGRSSPQVSDSNSGRSVTTNGGDATSAVSEMSVAYRAQKKIQDKIEAADMGLAILMGEAQRLERLMKQMRKDRKDGTDSTTTGGGTHSEAVEEDEDETERSFSTFQSTDRDFDDDDDDSMSSTGTNETEVRRRARIMQGCDVEYSFPHEFHEELEGALMNDAMSDSESENSSVLDSETSSIISMKGNRGRRGRTGFHMHVSPIVAIPTNGEGCVVLRENGAFDVVGKIPDVLRKKLFRPKGPMPDNIALGTLGRYYVHFEDGSFFFYGPPSLSKILIKGNKKQRRGEDRNRGQRNNKDLDVAVASVAFGKKLDDFFVVYSDGSWQSHGKSIPEGLNDLMKDRKDRADLMWVSLGSKGEWCARARNGRVWWEGVSDETDEALTEILSEEGENELSYIDFGTDETYFLLHK